MRYRFSPSRGLVIVRTELHGPLGSVVLRLALDTGATGTLVNQSRLIAAGYDPSASPQRAQITTGSGVEFVPVVVASRFSALGHERRGFTVLAHTLPPNTQIDGLLGLDFLRGLTLTVDFRAGDITLA